MVIFVVFVVRLHPIKKSNKNSWLKCFPLFGTELAIDTAAQTNKGDLLWR